MRDLDTEVEGEVTALRAVARWLDQDLRAGLDDLATTVAQQRADAAGDWLGEAGTAFARRAGQLARSADDGATITRDVAALVDGVADALRAAQDAMASVRELARAGGLTVDGLVVRHPGGGPPEAGAHPGPDATPAECDAWAVRDRAAGEHAARVDAWNACVRAADEAVSAWHRALAAAARAWEVNDTRYVNLSGALVSAGIQLELIRRTMPHLVGDVDHMRTRAVQLRAHLAAMVTPEGRVLDRTHYMDLLREAEELEAAHPAARRALSTWKLPKEVVRGLWVVDVAAATYGGYSDWHSGDETRVQAITSNAVPLGASIGASMLAGAGLGGAIGSAVPIPGAGTVAGVLAGGVAGLAAGAFTSGAVDSLFDSGAGSLSDWRGAVADGWSEATGMVSSVGEGVGEGVGEVFDAIF